MLDRRTTLVAVAAVTVLGTARAPAPAQDKSIVVASTATEWFGHEGTILRFVFKHSIILACLVGVLVMLQAHLYPFTEMVLK